MLLGAGPSECTDLDRSTALIQSQSYASVFHGASASGDQATHCYSARREWKLGYHILYVPAKTKRKAVADTRCDDFSRTGRMRIIALQQEDERLTAAEYFNRFRTIFLDTRKLIANTLAIASGQARVATQSAATACLIAMGVIVRDIAEDNQEEDPFPIAEPSIAVAFREAPRSPITKKRGSVPTSDSSRSAGGRVK